MKFLKLSSILFLFFMTQNIQTSDDEESSLLKTTLSYEESFDPRGFIDIKNTSGRTNIEGWDKNILQIIATKRASSQELLDATTVELRRSDSSVEIDTICPQQTNVFSSTIINNRTVYCDGSSVISIGGTNGITIGGISIERFLREGSSTAMARSIAFVDYVIRAPHSTLINAQSGSGRINMSGLLNRISLKTGSGATSVKDSTDISVQSGSGEIKITNATGRVKVQTGSGDITTIGDLTRADLQTGSGDIKVKGSEFSNLQTGSGDIKVYNSKNGSARAQTGSGDITMKGKFNEVFARAGSGDITIKKARIADALTHSGRKKVTLRGQSSAGDSSESDSDKE
ncbi:DUF4097 family beta strand repeat protein [Candidatus Babeliales bacterium]|nr:DUF4097 family beta strand repeat protein [Candidatus Babeliales bacterium]MBP9844149.1 DUF4097 family beta strand repeat protein [Candidatus Babeliales bacterium]